MTKEELHEAITALYERTKAGALEREERIEEITALSETYYNLVGDKPHAAALDRLTNLVIYEELTDTHPDKMSREEYPIMSETQLSRRKEGKHRKKEANYRIEVPLVLAENVGVDGRDYAYPARRDRSLREDMAIDEVAVSRNKGIRKRYNDFVNGKSSGQFTVNIATGIKTVRSDAQ